MSRAVITATIEDAGHFTPEMRAELVGRYAPHERDARLKGKPQLGSGAIFPVADEETITCDPVRIPDFWPQIGAMDFGWDHPFGAVHIAHDTEADIVYVTKAYRARQETPIIHVRNIRAWGDWLPWAWPHDGLQHSKDSGEPLAKQYRSNGINMLGSHATFPDGSTGVEAGLFEMLERMQTGRLKVFRHLNDWFEEFRLYHRKDGKVVKEHDDLMAATRYGIMMLRKGECPPRLFRKHERQNKPLFSDPLADFR